MVFFVAGCATDSFNFALGARVRFSSSRALFSAGRQVSSSKQLARISLEAPNLLSACAEVLLQVLRTRKHDKVTDDDVARTREHEKDCLSHILRTESFIRRCPKVHSAPFLGPRLRPVHRFEAADGATGAQTPEQRAWTRCIITATFPFNVIEQANSG